MKISIVNYKMGNIRSIQNALGYLDVASEVINTPEQILGSKMLILPGVGSFRKAMEYIRGMNLFDALNEAVLKQKTPILGICLGMQLLANESEEDGLTAGFGWIQGKVKRFPAEELRIKVPHIGFNSAYFQPKARNLFGGLGKCADFYFVHSYRMICNDAEDVSSWADYGERFAASVQRDNISGMQFHPEKSQSNGLTVLKNFCNIEVK